MLNNTTINFTAHVRKSLDRDGIIVDGKSHTIDAYKLIIDLDYNDIRELSVINEEHIPCDDGYFVIKWYEGGLCSYGYMQNKKENRPGHGGLWSSSAGSVYKHTGYSFIDVVASNRSFALPIEQAKSLLPDGYFITRLGERSEYNYNRTEPYIFHISNGYILD